MWPYAITAAAMLIAVVAVTRLMAAPPESPKTTQSKGVAVVELFTSEGCSSCPPAEGAVAELIAATKDRPVYVLAFHVDYFDRLGWADPFAARGFTERQVRYAETLKLRDVYTPQVIVNGAVEFVGSDRAKLTKAVASAIDTPVVGTVTGSATRDGENVRVAIEMTGVPADSIVNVAVVESGLVSEVRRGENRDRKLPHERVVRTLRTVVSDGSGKASVELSIPPVVRRDRSAIVVFAQNPVDLHVLAASEVQLPK